MVWESSIINLLPTYDYACEPYGSRFVCVIPGKSKVPSKDEVGGARGGG